MYHICLIHMDTYREVNQHRCDSSAFLGQMCTSGLSSAHTADDAVQAGSSCPASDCVRCGRAAAGTNDHLHQLSVEERRWSLEFFFASICWQLVQQTSERVGFNLVLKKKSLTYSSEKLISGVAECDLSLILSHISIENTLLL